VPVLHLPERHWASFVHATPAFFVGTHLFAVHVPDVQVVPTVQ
jgi:hypothetical protein